MTFKKGLTAFALMSTLFFVAACGEDAKDGSGNGDSNSAKDVPTFSGPNEVVLGDETVKLLPSTQCSIFNDFTVSISGIGADDDSIEFTFDVFDTETKALSVTTADGTQWYTETDLDITVDGTSSVAGTAELTAINGSGTQPATFEFTCD